MRKQGKKEIPSMDQWLQEAKKDPQAPKIGMYLVHNGVVRKSAKARVRMDDKDALDVSGMEFSYDEKKVEEAIAQTYQQEGIYYVRVWLNSGTLQVGDDLMYVLVGGDIRPHVIQGLEFLVGKLKNECVQEKELYDEEKDCAVGCLIMASGMSKRFGKNKLLAEYEGKTFVQRILDTTGQLSFQKRVVLTRSKEVEAICKEQGIEVLYHELTERREAIRLGIQTMKEMNACIFCPCDQPLLESTSIQKLVEGFQKQKRGMFRLSFEGQPGTPILFGREYFEELAHLPEKCGGSYLVKKYPDQVTAVEVGKEEELYDIDTQEDYQWLINQTCEKRKGEQTCLQ